MKRLLITFFPLVLLVYSSYSEAQEVNPHRHAVGINGVANNAGLGVGLHYEHFLSKEQRSTVFLQASFCFSRVGPAGFWYNGQPVEGEDRYPMMFLLQPGFRIYKKSITPVIQYMFGTYLVAGIGKGASGRFTLNTDNLRDRKLAAIIIANGMNVNLLKRHRILFEGDVGLGTDDSRDAPIIMGVAFFGQFSLSFSQRL